MDRGIPTEATLAAECAPTPMDYLVGTPRGRLRKLEKEFLTLPWEKAHDSVEVKLLSKRGNSTFCPEAGAGRARSARCAAAD